MNCPSCGAPLRLEGDQEGLACDYCKSIYYPEAQEEGVRVLDDAAEESCPVCAIPLMHALVARERVRYCRQCRGMLIPMGKFLALVDELRTGASRHSVPPPPDPHELNRHIDCPRCHRRMDTHFYGGPGNIVIDDCSRCFLNWLDHGELMRIVAAPDRSYGEEYGEPGDARRPKW